jgi:hypothetical protein
MDEGEKELIKSWTETVNNLSINRASVNNCLSLQNCNKNFLNSYLENYIKNIDTLYNLKGTAFKRPKNINVTFKHRDEFEKIKKSVNSFINDNKYNFDLIQEIYNSLLSVVKVEINDVGFKKIKKEALSRNQPEGSEKREEYLEEDDGGNDQLEENEEAMDIDPEENSKEKSELQNSPRREVSTKQETPITIIPTQKNATIDLEEEESDDGVYSLFG